MNKKECPCKAVPEGFACFCFDFDANMPDSVKEFWLKAYYKFGITQPGLSDDHDLWSNPEFNELWRTLN